MYGMKGTFHKDRDFFILLRAGLWEKKGDELSENPDWEHIYRMADQFKVQGIIAEGISVIGAIDAMPEGIFTDFIKDRACIVKMNNKVDNVQAKLCEQMDSEGIPYAVLKGQALARSYAKPEIRRSGDIDFLISESDFSRVNALFSENTDEAEYHNEADLHHALLIDGVWVENHAMAKSYFTRRLDRVMETERRRMFARHDFDSYEFCGQTIRTTNPEYTALFLIGHILRHITTEGISLKQLCDWARYIYDKRDRLDKVKFDRMLEESGIRSLWRKFSVFAVEWLGMEAGWPLLYEGGYSRQGDLVWHTIKSVNESKKESNKKNIGNFWLHYLDSYRNFIIRNRFLWRFSKRAYTERLWDKFGELPVTFVKKTLGIGGDGFRKNRFKQS